MDLVAILGADEQSEASGDKNAHYPKLISSFYYVLHQC